MSSAVLIYVCIFAGAFLAFQTVVGMGRQAAVRVAHVNRRLKMIEQSNETEDILDKIRKSRSLDKQGNLTGLIDFIDRLVLQSGLPLGKTGIYWILAVLPVVLSVGLYLFKGQIALSVGAAVIGLIAPILILRFLVKRRQAKAVKQLPEALDVIIRALKAGYPVPVAMGLVAREMPDPIGSEFGMVGDEISFGSGVSEAIVKMCERIGHDDFLLFSAIIQLQERTGGNLAELLSANAKTIRGRQKMRLKIKAASAEGRMSALILNAAPIGMFLIIRVMSPEFYGAVDHHPAFQYSMAGIVVWMIIGNLIMRRMINFKI